MLYKFGPFCLDDASCVLSCNGEEVTPQLQPKAVDVLLVLIERSGHLVEREELIERVWPDTSVIPANLDTQIKQIRKALKDNPKEPKYVKTVSKRSHRFPGGYQFIAAVERVGGESNQTDQITLRTPNSEMALSAKGTGPDKQPSRLSVYKSEVGSEPIIADRAVTVLYPGLDFKPEIEALPDFTGRTWLASKVDEWLADERRPVTIVVGKQGIGKSAIAAWLRRTRPEVVGVYFCTDAQLRSLNPFEFVDSLVAQLRTQLPGFVGAIEGRYPHIRHQTAIAAFRELIVEPMWRVTVPPQAKLLIIDSLDTAITHKGETILDVLLKHIQTLPKWLRIIATSRPNHAILGRVGHFRIFDLDAQQNNREDVRRYLDMQLKASMLVAHAGRVDERAQQRLNELVAGNFQCARVLMAHLENGTFTLVDLNRLGSGLAKVYSFVFEWCFRDLERYQCAYKPLFQVLVAAHEPLRISFLRQVCGDDPEVASWQRPEFEAYLDPTLGREKELCWLHSTVREWLTDINQAGPYFVEVSAGHERLAATGWSEFKRGVSEMSEYALAHLPLHLAKLGRWEDLLRLISCPEMSLLSRWIDKGEGEVGLICLEGVVHHLERENQLIEAAGFATQIAQIFIERGSYKEATHWLNYALRNTSCCRGRRERAISLHELGSLSLYRAKYQQAEKRYRRALWLCLCGFPAYHSEAAANLIALATVSLETFNLSQTIRLARRAITKAKLAADVSHLIAAVRLMASAYRRLGEYHKAYSYIDLALTTCAAVGESLETVRLFLLAGWAQVDQALLGENTLAAAADSFHKSLDQAKRIGNYYGILEAEFGLAWCAFGTRDVGLASKQLEQVDSLLPSQPYLGPRAGYLLGVAKLRRLEKEVVAASAQCQEVIDLCCKYRILNWEAKALVELGSIQWDLGHYTEANIIWQRALRVAKKISKSFRSLVQKNIDLCRVNPQEGAR